MIDFPELIDHHCHGVVLGDLDRAAFEALFSEGHRPAAPGTSQFDKPLGLMIRRHCAPILGLEAHSDPEAYVERRREMGSDAANRALMRAAGVDALLVDTGHRSDSITGFEELGELADAGALEVVRIEAVMEAAAGRSGSAAELLEGFAGSLEAGARDAVGLKSIVAYRSSFDIDQSAPSEAEALRAAGSWLSEIERGGPVRLADPVLLRHALFRALDLGAGRGLPLQLHVGFGDLDITMHKCDPTVFTAFITEAERRNVAITLLHCWPFHREAAWLAEVFSNVYFDLGAIMNYTGPESARVLAEAMELGPFHKQLYSSDAFGLAELHALGRITFARALQSVLDTWIGAGDLTTGDADRIVEMIGSVNPRRIYPLDRFEGFAAAAAG